MFSCGLNTAPTRQENRFSSLTCGSSCSAVSGAVPGGYSGGSGIIFSLVLPAYSGTGVTNAIKLSSVRVYRNDGLGTQAQVSVKSFTIGNSNAAVDKSVQEQLYIGDEKKDNIPPEVFSPQLSQDDRVFDGKWFINFSTVDKQSGIDHYEIQETRSGTIEGGKWKPVTSPYLLEDQELHSFIYVIAIDRQGNERVIKVFPRRPLSWTQQYGNTLVAVGVGVIIVLLSYDIIRRRRVPQSIIR